MIAGAATGEWLDFGKGPFGAEEMKAWSADRTVRASVLRHLLIAPQWPVDAKGVRLRGVRISGKLDLEASSLRCPLWLDSCYLDDPESLCLNQATAVSLSLTDCLLAGFAGDMLAVRELDLGRSTLTGPLRLSNAEIAGQFSCSGAKLSATDPSGYALDADGIKVGGDMFLDQGFASGGAIRLAGAAIAGDLSCRGANLASSDYNGYTLNADGIKVGGDMFLDQGFASDGEIRFASDGAIRLAGAAIAGHLFCSGAKLTGADYNGYALNADKLQVGGDMFLDNGFLSNEAIGLSGAVIAGLFSCSGAKLTTTYPGRDALNADGIKIGGDMFLDQGFASEGAIRLVGGEITGSLICRDTEVTAHNSTDTALLASGMTVRRDVFLGSFKVRGAISLTSIRVGGSVILRKLTFIDSDIALDASGAQIAGVLRWEPAAPVSGQVNLEGAEVGKLEDSWSQDRAAANGYWPTDGGLRLNGFVYRALGGVPPATVNQRLEWIRSQHTEAGFAVQPYEQLATVYRQAGQDTEARNVAITRYVDQRKFGDLSLARKVGNWLLDKTIKYGYQNWRAAVGMVAVYLSVVAISVLAQHQGVIVPIGDTTNLHPLPTASRCTAGYQCFYPAGYAFDVVFPLINVHQAQSWGINAAVPWGWLWIGSTWIATALGWTGATFLVAGLTSLGRRN